MIQDSARRLADKLTCSIWICTLWLSMFSGVCPAQDDEPKGNSNKNKKTPTKKELTKKWGQHVVANGRFRVTAPGNYSSSRKTHFQAVDGATSWQEFSFSSTNPAYTYNVRYIDLKSDVSKPDKILAKQMDIAIENLASSKVEHREDNAERSLANISIEDSKLKIAYHLEGSRLYEVSVRSSDPKATFEEEVMVRFVNSFKPIKLPKSKTAKDAKGKSKKPSKDDGEDP